jgi:diguanylate cyclase (GGDEF)-like protein
MHTSPTASLLSLDHSTMFIVATCITALLGLFLLYVWTQDRIRALAWWGAAYLIGGSSVAMWGFDRYVADYLPVGIPNAMLFFACGMVWNGARMFHGRRVLYVTMGAGALAWLLACNFETFRDNVHLRIILSAMIISNYTFLTAWELWRERRRKSLFRFSAILIPILHAMVFLFPIPLASLLPEDNNTMALASGWIAIFAIETLLYAVGTAFIVLILAKERTIRIHKTAASTDPLTGVFNRRAFLEGAGQLVTAAAKKRQQVSMLVFDLDHFKSINDRFGHGVGDETLSLFARTATGAMRTTDHFGRLGGEEFAMIMTGSEDDASVVAERVRAAFEAAGVAVVGRAVNATVSVGIAAAPAPCRIETLLMRADAALYDAKDAGRNRVAIALVDDRFSAAESAIETRTADVRDRRRSDSQLAPSAA